MSDAEMLTRINTRIAELANEVATYATAVQAKDPTIDDRIAFEGWAVQKLAGLQVAVESLAESLRQSRT